MSANEKIATRTEVSLVAAAADVATNAARWGLKLAALPVLPLPQPLRGGFFESARLAIEASALLPRAAVRALDGLAEEIDDLESRSSRREDLGSRLRREQRRQARR